MDAWEYLSGGSGAGDIESPEVKEPSPERLFHADVFNLGEYGFQGMPTHNACLDQYPLVRDRELRATPCEIAVKQEDKRNNEDEKRQRGINSLIHRGCREGYTDKEEQHRQKKHFPM